MPSPLLQRHNANLLFQPEATIARGVLIIDHDLLDLIPLLARKSFKVYSAIRGMTNDEIGPLLAHRVLVTNNLEAFRESAAIHEFSIVDVANCDRDAPSLAAAISRSWMRLGLKHKQGFVLRLSREGEPVVEEVE